MSQRGVRCHHVHNCFVSYVPFRLHIIIARAAPQSVRRV
jgi:hypothetical protein